MSKLNKIVKLHIQQLLKPYLNPQEESKIYYPTLDRHVSNYFKSHKSLGPNQRKLISDNVYDIIRHQVYLNHLCKGNKSLDYRLDLLHSSDFQAQRENSKLSKQRHIINQMDKMLFPQIVKQSQLRLYQKIQESVGQQHEAFQICKAMNTRAPVTLRVNPSKTNRKYLMEKLGKYLNIDLRPTQISPYGVKLPINKNAALHETKQFQEGHFQIQDQGSQIAALQAACKPGDLVLDYCSGSGGKSLAIAHLLEGKGQIYLHQPRQKALINAKKRFQRAGITNIQYHNDEATLSKHLSQKADWILLDVPCTGTGTIRRNPDIKLRYSQKQLDQMVLLQQKIFLNSLKYLKKSGKILYITCSILAEENQEQIKKFIKVHGLQIYNKRVLKTKTEKGGMDSMFAAVLQPKKKIIS